MEQAREYRIGASRQVVWAGLNDPKVLKQCIRGCQNLEQTGDATFAAAVQAKIGPIDTVFNADLELENLDPPNGYSLNASVKGGEEAFGDGTAEVKLSDDDHGTLLRYSMNATLGGELAQIGSKLIDSAADEMADDFFARFSNLVGAADTGSALSSATITSAKRSAEDYQPSQQWKIWAIMFAILILAVVLTL